MKSAVLALPLIASLVSAVCDYGTTFNPRSLEERAPVATYNFHETDGALGWHGLNSNYKLCAKGKNQSPINIESNAIAQVAGSSLTFQVASYPTGAECVNLGSTVQAFTNGTLVRRNKKYNLLQFHFHTPSEHHVDKQHFSAEVHFVFQAADNALAVVGFLIEVGTDAEANPLLANIFEHVADIAVPGSEGLTGPLDFTELAAHLQSSQVYQYSGSLTTPPCTQGIAWNVVANPIYIDIATYRAAKGVMGFNSRFTQNHPGQKNLIKHACDVL
jgi:carbonic anhydrase